jgi:thiamine-phosphate pyrophosphorylase
MDVCPFDVSNQNYFIQKSILSIVKMMTTKNGNRQDHSIMMRQHGGIYFVTSGDYGMSHLDVAIAALKGGVRIVQYREKEKDEETMIAEASEIKKACKEYGAIFIVDDKIRVAMAVDADGVHLGQEDMPLQTARKLWPNKIIGISAKNPQQAAAAEKDGATYLGVGAVFPTNTKVKTTVIGTEGLIAVRRSTKLPVYAIGGIKAEHIPGMKALGVDGIAVITAIADNDDRTQAAAALVEEWKSA